jgi:RNA polymerase sigma-70 factor (ECF subfamily)
MHEDAELIERAGKGDEVAFESLMLSYHDRLMGLLMRMARDPLLAQELAQQTWIKVWKSLPRYKGRSSFFTWLYSIATRTALDHFRKIKRLNEYEYMDELEAGGAAGGCNRPDQTMINAEIQQEFDQAMNRLPAKLRVVLVLREVEGLSYKEIARIVKCREGTVMSRLYNARRQMQQFFKGVQP